MLEIFNFLKANWQLIASIILIIISFILALVKKKPVQVVNGILPGLLLVIPDYVIEAELKFPEPNQGLHKFHYVIGKSYDFIKSNFPGVIPDSYYGIISHFIESLLNTPQKK